MVQSNYKKICLEISNIFSNKIDCLIVQEKNLTNKQKNEAIKIQQQINDLDSISTYIMPYSQVD